MPSSLLSTPRRALRTRGQRAFQGFVRRSDDRRLERTVGSPRGLRLLFAAMAGAYVPEQAEGFTGDIQYDLRGADGRVRHWTVAVTPDRAAARPGASPRPELTVKLGLADFARLAAGDLDPGNAVLSGRMDLEGDFGVATRLGAMFGRASAF